MSTLRGLFNYGRARVEKVLVDAITAKLGIAAECPMCEDRLHIRAQCSLCGGLGKVRKDEASFAMLAGDAKRAMPYQGEEAMPTTSPNINIPGSGNVQGAGPMVWGRASDSSASKYSHIPDRVDSGSATSLDELRAELVKLHADLQRARSR